MFLSVERQISFHHCLVRFGYDCSLMINYFRDVAEYLDTLGFVVSSRLLNCSLDPLLDWVINFSFGEYVF
jgi:hypothetical protein